MATKRKSDACRHCGEVVTHSPTATYCDKPLCQGARKSRPAQPMSHPWKRTSAARIGQWRSTPS
jgi:hypothetical protein